MAGYRGRGRSVREHIRDCLATTGLTMVVIALAATFRHAGALCISGIYEALAVNIVIHAGIALLGRFESRYFMAEIAAELGFVLAVAASAAYLFDWTASAPVWVYLLVVAAVYALGAVIGTIRVRGDLAFINARLESRRNAHGGESA